MRIPDEILKEFEKNGAVCLRKVFDSRWIDMAREAIAKNMANPGPHAEWLKDEKSYFFDDYFNWKRIAEIENYAMHSPAASIAGQITKSEYAAFYHEHVLVKEAGSSKETPWHQDQAYYPIDGDKVCSIWMPVDYVPESTCLRFVAGSHKWGWFHPRKFATSNQYSVTNSENFDRLYKTVPDIDEEDGKHEILKWDLEPGDCIVFHMKALHGARGNESMDRPRRVLSTRWLGDDAVIATRPWEVSPPYSGKLKPGDSAASDEFPIVWRRNNQ